MVKTILAQTYTLRERRLDILGEKSHGGNPVVSLSLSFALSVSPMYRMIPILLSSWYEFKF